MIHQHLHSNLWENSICTRMLTSYLSLSLKTLLTSLNQTHLLLMGKCSWSKERRRLTSLMLRLVSSYKKLSWLKNNKAAKYALTIRQTLSSVLRKKKVPRWMYLQSLTSKKGEFHLDLPNNSLIKDFTTLELRSMEKNLMFNWLHTRTLIDLTLFKELWKMLLHQF